MLVLALGSITAQADIPVLAVDDLGNETTTIISDSDYAMAMSLESETSALVAEDQLDLAMATPHLKFNGIQVGLEVIGSVGPSALKLGAGINQQFFFEMKK